MRWLTILALVGCNGKGLELLGSGDGDVSDSFVMLASEANGLAETTDVAIDPGSDDKLWTVNKELDRLVIFDSVSTGAEVEIVDDPYALHFMEQVTSIAMGAPGTFATCQDGQNTYNDRAEGNGFTGPSLWSTDPDILGISNPEAVAELGGDLGSHLDMLHESPECMGIAWDHDNVYWVFDGFNGDLVRYDFAEDHGPGFDDHCDGDIQRWVGLDLARVEDMVSHLVMDHETGMLYIADTGNGRILAVDTHTGVRGGDLSSVEEGACRGIYDKPGPDHYEWEGGTVFELVSGLDDPTGIELHDDMIFVAESGASYLSAYTLEGELVDEAATGFAPGAMQGIAIDTEGNLWSANSMSSQLLFLSAER